MTPAGVATVFLGGVLLLASCSFERRPEVEGEDARVEAEARAPEAILSDPTGSALETLAVFREAVSIGDLSLALALLDPEVRIVDRLVSLEGRRADEFTRGELLLELRRSHAEGMQLEVLDSRVLLLNESALVSSTLAVLQASEGSSLAREVARAEETVLLMLTPAGWRVRHFHRSTVPSSVDLP